MQTKKIAIKKKKEAVVQEKKIFEVSVNYHIIYRWQINKLLR